DTKTETAASFVTPGGARSVTRSDSEPADAALSGFEFSPDFALTARSAARDDETAPPDITATAAEQESPDATAEAIAFDADLLSEPPDPLDTSVDLDLAPHATLQDGGDDMPLPPGVQLISPATDSGFAPAADAPVLANRRATRTDAIV